MKLLKSYDTDEILEIVAEHFAVTTDDDVEGNIVVIWNDDDGIDIYEGDDEPEDSVPTLLN